MLSKQIIPKNEVISQMPIVSPWFCRDSSLRQGQLCQTRPMTPEWVVRYLVATDQPFEPEMTTPCIKIRWLKKNSNIGGTTITTEAAMIKCVLTAYKP